MTSLIRPIPDSTLTPTNHASAHFPRSNRVRAAALHQKRRVRCKRDHGNRHRWREPELDGDGEAVVVLPVDFEALNRDFRHQLTALGAPGPNLYVAGEVARNRFKIAGGTPGMRVSWQVTGTRQDAFANAHRIPVDEEKPRERARTLPPPAGR